MEQGAQRQDHQQDDGVALVSPLGFVPVDVLDEQGLSIPHA
jgi:hypothetical protein